MTGIYYTDAADWLRAIGITVVEIDGWKTRARSSGGFPAATGALGIQWHHTASATSPENDTGYMFFAAPTRPVGNMLLARDGSAWIGAAGAANTAGRGGPLTMSRGVIPLDSANTRSWAIEAANDGAGEPWPQVQIDAYMAISNELNRRFNNQPTDIFNHATWAPSRKIDPARHDAVQGPWRPARANNAGTWAQADVTAEAARRATPTPEPDPTPSPTPPPATLEAIDMLMLARQNDPAGNLVSFWVGTPLVGRRRLDRPQVNIMLATNQCFDCGTGRSLAGAISGDSITPVDTATMDAVIGPALP